MFQGFPGFSEPQFTQVPDILFDELAPDLSESELRVLLYIIRRTFGFKKSIDAISINQMVEGITTRNGKTLDRGTGMSRPSVVKGTRGLVEKGIIVASRTKNPDGGDAPTTYQLRFRTANNSAGGELISLTPPGKASEPPGVKHVNPQVETVLQDTDLQQTDPPSNRTPKLDKIVEEISCELNDRQHIRSNQTRARRLLEQASMSERDFIGGLVYEARDRAKRSKRIKKDGVYPFTKNRIPYFFACLEDLLGFREHSNGSTSNWEGLGLPATSDRPQPERAGPATILPRNRKTIGGPLVRVVPLRTEPDDNTGTDDLPEGAEMAPEPDSPGLSPVIRPSGFSRPNIPRKRDSVASVAPEPEG